jgi:hypothetical protein
MDPLYSPEIENWFPKGGTIAIRRGTQDWGLCSAQPVALAEYVSNSARYFVGLLEGGLVDDITSGIGSSIDSAGTRLGGGDSYTCNFGGRIYMKTWANSTDVYYWAGSGNITAAAFTGPGGDDKALWKILGYKNRLYFIGFQTASVWYGGDGILGGAALTEYPFQNLLTQGGNLWHIGSFSMVGDTMQELFCAISETGEVLLYQGLNPGDATWSKVGHYFIPAPTGRRSFIPWGSDIVIITYQGIVSLREWIASLGTEYTFLSDEINDQVTTLLVPGSFAPGEPALNGIYYPKRILFIN